MKSLRTTTIGSLALLLGLFVWACQSNTSNSTETKVSAPNGAGQSAVSDDESAKDVVKVAVASPDHKTLVTAVQTAGLVDVLSNAGPFTVFAPTDAAFNALPKGTVEGKKPGKVDRHFAVPRCSSRLPSGSADGWTGAQYGQRRIGDHQQQRRGNYDQ